MTKFLLRFSESLLSVWAVITVVFFVTRRIGDPVVLLLPVGASKADMAIMRQQLGLDLPLWRQYVHYFAALLHGDFGQSFLFARPALGVVLERVPATLLLAASSLLLSVILGSIMGYLLATRQRGILRRAISSIVVLGQATPVFWLGMVLILLFAVKLPWFPTSGIGTTNRWRHLILPTLSIAFYLAAQVARIAESSLEEVLGKEYVRTAVMKGLSARTVALWYVARNALIPVVTLVGLLVAEMVGGSVVIETIFAWPGVGRLLYQAIQNQDFPVVSAGVIVVAVGVILINLLVDTLYLILDPRIRGRA